MVMRSKEANTDDAAGGGAEGGRRPTAVPAPAAAASEMSDRPRRRTFTVQTKLRVLAETDRAAEVGGIGAILRREGLYSSTLRDWRRQRDNGALGALTPAKRGPKRRRATLWRRSWPRPSGRMHGSGGDWSTPRRSSKSKKKLQPCWGSRWRRPDSDDEP